jgi:hypothetical protein
MNASVCHKFGSRTLQLYLANCVKKCGEILNRMKLKKEREENKKLKQRLKEMEAEESTKHARRIW